MWTYIPIKMILYTIHKCSDAQYNPAVACEVLSIFSRLKIYDYQYKHIEANSYIKAVNSYNMHVYVYNYMNM